MALNMIPLRQRMMTPEAALVIVDNRLSAKFEVGVISGG